MNDLLFLSCPVTPPPLFYPWLINKLSAFLILLSRFSNSQFVSTYYFLIRTVLSVSDLYVIH